jgi:hypothetical protein
MQGTRRFHLLSLAYRQSKGDNQMEAIYLTLSHLGVALFSSAITIFILYKFFNAGRLLMKRPPLGIVSDGLKWLYLRTRRRKYIYNYLECADRIFWYDWDRGFGYGYMKEDEVPTPGDVIQVKLRTMKKGYKGKVMQLFFYQVWQPDQTMPNFFIFKTILGGIKNEQKPETDEELGHRFKSFQRLI